MVRTTVTHSTNNGKMGEHEESVSLPLVYASFNFSREESVKVSSQFNSPIYVVDWAKSSRFSERSLKIRRI